MCVYSQSGGVIFMETDYHELQPRVSFVSGVRKLCPWPRAIAA